MFFEKYLSQSQDLPDFEEAHQSPIKSSKALQGEDNRARSETLRADETLERLFHDFKTLHLRIEELQKENTRLQSVASQTPSEAMIAAYKKMEEAYYSVVAENCELKASVEKQENEIFDLKQVVLVLRDQLKQADGLSQQTARQIQSLKQEIFSWFSFDVQPSQSPDEEALRSHLKAQFLSSIKSHR